MNYDERLQTLAQRLVRKRQLEQVLQALTDRRVALKAKVFDLTGACEREQRDVDRLESGGLRPALLRLTGRLEARLTGEQAQLEAARAKRDVAQKELDAVQAQIDDHRSELVSLGDCEEAYGQALQEKESAMRRAGAEAYAELTRLRSEAVALEVRSRELGEAKREGRTAAVLAGDVLRALDSASGWATADFFDSGILSDLGKYDALSMVEERVEALQLQLGRFRAELADVAMEAKLQVQVDGLLKFTDFFFDDIFSCFSVADRIERAQDSVDGLRRRIDGLLSDIEDRLCAARSEKVHLEDQIEKLILQTRL